MTDTAQQRLSILCMQIEGPNLRPWGVEQMLHYAASTASDEKPGLQQALRILASRFGRLRDVVGEIKPDPIPMRLVCEGCGKLHIDEGEFVTKSHHTHSCQHCGLTWRPAVVPTVGVQFLPGFKNEPPIQSGLDALIGQQLNDGVRSEGLGSQAHGRAATHEPDKSSINVDDIWSPVGGGLDVVIMERANGPYPICVSNAHWGTFAYKEDAFRMLFRRKGTPRGYVFRIGDWVLTAGSKLVLRITRLPTEKDPYFKCHDWGGHESAWSPGGIIPWEPKVNGSEPVLMKHLNRPGFVMERRYLGTGALGYGVRLWGEDVDVLCALTDLEPIDPSSTPGTP